MKGRTIAIVLTALAIAAIPALAGEKGHDHGKPVEMTGWIVDEKCGAANAKADAKDCVLECHKKGSPLVLASGGKTYKLSDQKRAQDNVGAEVVVKGQMEADAIKVASIVKADKKG